VTTSVLVTITDIGTAVQFTVTGQTITVIECGGCPVEEIFQGKLDSQNPETTDQDFIRGLWLSGYDGDPDANGLMVEVEYQDRAARAAYEAAVDSAKPLYRVRYTLSADDLGEHAVRSVGDGYPGGDEYSKYDSEAEAKASILATFGDHGEWIDEDGRTHYHTSPKDACGSAWVEVAQ